MHDCRGILQTPGWLLSLWCWLWRRVRQTRRYVIATVMGQWEERPSYQLTAPLLSFHSLVHSCIGLSSTVRHILPLVSLISATQNIVNDVNMPVGWCQRFSSFLFPLSFRDGQSYPGVRYCVSQHFLLSVAIHLSVSLLWFCYPETNQPLLCFPWFLKEVDLSSGVLSYNDTVPNLCILCCRLIDEINNLQPYRTWLSRVKNTRHRNCFLLFKGFLYFSLFWGSL